MSSHSSNGVLCAGNIVFDILVRPVDRLSWGSTTWVEMIEERLGGNGANTSYALAKLGVPVRLLVIVGQDRFGDQLLVSLNSASVDVSLVSRSKASTATTIALVSSDGERLFLHQPGSSTEAFQNRPELGPDLVNGFFHFHVANVFAIPALRRKASGVLHDAKVAGLSTSLDTGWDSSGRWLEDLKPCLPHVDILFVNRDESRMLTGSPEPGGAAAAFMQLGAGSVVVKLGADGCAVFSPGVGLLVPAFEVNVVDTTGAGDCFAGGYLAALHRGLSPDDAARFANAVGALTVQKLGSVQGLLSWDQAQSWMKTAKAKVR
jgi:sugar/nucleoside kinase (ribokinase family)